MIDYSLSSAKCIEIIFLSSTYTVHVRKLVKYLPLLTVTQSFRSSVLLHSCKIISVFLIYMFNCTFLNVCVIDGSARALYRAVPALLRCIHYCCLTATPSGCLTMGHQPLCTQASTKRCPCS